MSDEGMAAVLAEHWSASTHADGKPIVDKCDGCGAVILTWGGDGDSYGVDPRNLLADHQAKMLAAAGYGSKAEALREAAEAYLNEYGTWGGAGQGAWLRGRADEMEGK